MRCLPSSISAYALTAGVCILTLVLQSFCQTNQDAVEKQALKDKMGAMSREERIEALKAMSALDRALAFAAMTLETRAAALAAKTPEDKEVPILVLISNTLCDLILSEL